jgi:hypothetical protein
MKYLLRVLTTFYFTCAVSMMTAQDCSTTGARLPNAEAKVKQDISSLRMLRAGITSQDLDDAVNQSEEGRKQAVLSTISALMDGALNATDASLGTKSIAGHHLKNGLGSIGTGQANTLIGLIRDEGGVKQALIPLLRSLSQMNEKTASLEYLDLLSRAASGIKSTAELGASENTLEETEALFGLAAAIAGRGDIAVSVAQSVVNTTYTQTEVYLLSKSINQLTNLNEAQLHSLQILSGQLHRDVQNLKSVRKDLEHCQDEGAIVGTWIVTIKGDISSWNDSIVVTKIGPGKFQVAFGSYPSSDACAYPLIVTQTGPATYAGKNTVHDDACYDNSSEFEVQGNKISIRSRVTQSNHSGPPSAYTGSGVRR